MQTTISAAPPTARAGLLYGKQQRVLTKWCAAAVSGGQFVTRDASDVKAKVPTSSAEVLAGLGFVIFDAAKATGDGATVDYEAGSNVPVLNQGPIWASCEEAVTQGQTVYVRHTANGGNTVLGKVRNDGDSNTCEILVGAYFAATTTGAGPALVFLDSLAPSADVSDLSTQLAVIQGAGYISIPMASWRLSADGAAIPAFANGSADGFSLVSSEAFGLRINDDSTTHFATSVAMPPDLDATEDVTLHFMGFRVGTADAANAVLTLNAFIVSATDADTADSDILTSNTGAFGAATTIVSEVTATLPAADVPAAPCILTVDMVVGSGMTTDDLVIMASWLTYKRLTA
jgi:hypothetical protein